MRHVTRAMLGTLMLSGALAGAGMGVAGASSGPRAHASACAAEAAHAQGAFWEMHDVLLRHQEALTPNDLIGYAEELGLD